MFPVQHPVVFSKITKCSSFDMASIITINGILVDVKYLRKTAICSVIKIGVVIWSAFCREVKILVKMNFLKQSHITSKKNQKHHSVQNYPRQCLNEINVQLRSMQKSRQQGANVYVSNTNNQTALGVCSKEKRTMWRPWDKHPSSSSPWRHNKQKTASVKKQARTRQPRANPVGEYETTQDPCDLTNHVQISLKEQTANGN